MSSRAHNTSTSSLTLLHSGWSVYRCISMAGCVQYGSLMIILDAQCFQKQAFDLQSPSHWHTQMHDACKPSPLPTTDSLSQTHTCPTFSLEHSWIPQYLDLDTKTMLWGAHISSYLQLFWVRWRGTGEGNGDWDTQMCISINFQTFQFLQ